MESRIHQKQQKRVRECLTDLEEEIEVAISFLRQLRRHSIDSVSNISTISPSKQLDEISRVHSFLMKYLDAVSNVNWKFELMEIEGASDLSFYININRGLDLYTKKSNFDMDEKKHEQPQKPFENVINKEQLDDVQPPPYSEIDKIVEESPKLIDFSNPSNEDEEIKEINQDVSQKLKFEDLKGISFSKNDDVGNTYKGLPIKKEENKSEGDIDTNYKGLPIKTKENKPDVLNLTEERQEAAKVYEKVVVEEITEEIIEKIRLMHIGRLENLEYKGLVEHIVSPGEFYVHFLITEEISQFEIMKGIIKSLSDQYDKLKYPYNDEKLDIVDRRASAMHILGDYALWYESDEGEWHRVQIIDYGWQTNNDLVKIFLFDYGDSKTVPLSQLKPLDNSLRKFPMFAQRCHLAGIYPIGSKSNGKLGEWSKEDTELFKVLTNTDDPSSPDCKIVIGKHDLCYHPDSLPIKLYMKNNVSVNDDLLSLGYAVQLDQPPAPNFSISAHKTQQNKVSFKVSPISTVSPAGNRDKKKSKAIISAEKDNVIDNWDPMKEDYDSYANNLDLDTNDPASYIYGYVPHDYERVCHHYNRTGRCSKGDACRFEHVRLDPEGYTTDKEEVFKSAFNPLPPLSIDDTISVEVTCISNVNLFFCVRTQERNSDEETLESLVEFMNEDENVRKMKKLTVPPARGQIVIGKFSLDDYWYRARVLNSCPESDEYELFFVDYGNTETKRLSSIRHMEPRYLHLPFQAMKCQLYNVGPHPDVSRKDLNAFFNSLVHDKVLRARIMHLLPAGEQINLTVRLFDENYRDIGKELINKNYAVEQKSIGFSDDVYPG